MTGMPTVGIIVVAGRRPPLAYVLTLQKSIHNWFPKITLRQLPAPPTGNSHPVL